MDIPTIHPPALRPGDTIGIVAPAGPIETREAFHAGVATLERLGFRVRFNDRIFQSIRYLAGDDRSRAEELTQYLENPEVRAILALRGGYGCSRLIPLLDEKRLRPHCKIFMGFSDLTTLHLYFHRRFRWVTIHGPMVTTPSLGKPDPEAEEHLISLLTDPTYTGDLSFAELESWSGGAGEGILVGGCLSLVTASLGTPYEIRTEGKILFLEDLGEPPYRIDRMLTQLKSAGKLAAVQGIVLGNFEDCESVEGPYFARDTLKEILAELDVPVLANFPAGHGTANWALPLGSRVRLDADDKKLHILEPAVRKD